MDWTRILAYIAGSVDQELLLRNEYLAAENRILRAQLNGLWGAIMRPPRRYGPSFDRRLRRLGIKQVRTPFRCPVANGANRLG